VGRAAGRHRHAALRVGSHLGSLDADNHRLRSRLSGGRAPPKTPKCSFTPLVLSKSRLIRSPAWRELSSIFLVTGFSSVGCGLFSVADHGASRRSSSSSGLASFRWSPCSGCRSGRSTRCAFWCGSPGSTGWAFRPFQCRKDKYSVAPAQSAASANNTVVNKNSCCMCSFT
jgi:hypothetical protein